MRQIRLETMQMRNENVLKNNVPKYNQLMSGFDLEICIVYHVDFQRAKRIVILHIYSDTPFKY